ncbi:MAG: response regulator [Pseudomonadota bacterium]
MLAQDPLTHTVASDVVYRWTVEDGLPINAVTDLIQDEAGFLWLSTRAGLVRFDGLFFKTYDSQNYPGLPTDRLTHLYQTQMQHFWMRSEQFFMIRFDGQEFAALDTWPGFAGAQVLSSDQNMQGWLALGMRDGLAMIDANGPQRILSDSIQGTSEVVLWPNPQRIWAVVERELFAITMPQDSDADTGEAQISQRWPLPALSLSLLETDTALWIGTENGLYRLDFPITLNSQPIAQSELPRGDTNGLAHHPEGGVLVDSGNAVWWLRQVGTDQRWQTEKQYEGFTFRQQTAFLVPFQGSTGVHLSNGLVTIGDSQRQFDAAIRAALLDRDGNTWLALHGGGLALYRPSSLRLLGMPEGLPGENVYPVFQANDGAIWIGTLKNGAVRIDPDSNAPEPFINYQSDTLLAWTIAEFDDGIWLGGKPCKIVDRACVDQPLYATEAGNDNFVPGNVYLIYRDQHGRGWLGTQFGGLYEKRGERWIQSPLMHNDWPISTPIRTAEEAPDSALWLGTNGDGVIRIEGSAIEHYSMQQGLSSNLVRDLWFDRNGDLLIATENRGLCRLQRTADTGQSDTAIRCINTANGLFSNSLHQIQADNNDQLWISTNRGIFWLNQSELEQVFDGTVERISQTGTINASTGMRNSELNGGAFPTGLRDPSGRLWWPSQRGLVVFDPDQSPVQSPAVRGLVDEVIAGSERYAANQLPLELPSGERNVQLTLTAAAFTDPANIQFRFRIPAIDSSWVETGRSRLIGPLNLPPGELEIMTQARAGAGPWGETSLLQIHVPYFWYEYTLVQAVFIALVIGLTAGLFHAREQARARRSAELEQTIDQRTAELRSAQQQTEQALESVRRSSRLRTELFANIGHELRTPLTLISGPLEDAAQAQRPVNASTVSTITHSTRRMQRLVNQILDLRQADESGFRLDRTPVEATSLLQQCCAPFTALIASKRLNLSLRSSLAEAQASLDRDAFEKIIGNLLSNAIKFSRPGTEIEVAINAESDQNLIITVQDQGPGVAQEEADYIFERFYRTKLSQQQAIEGTGIGLSLARQLAHLHDGDIRLQNPGTAGAIFSLELPALSIVRSAHTTALELSETEPTSAMSTVESAIEPDTPTGPPSLSEDEGSSSTVPTINGLDTSRSRPRVLVIEDDPGLREYIASCLSDRYEILEAGNGGDGLEQARTNKPDLIVTDVMMPGMDGFMLVRELRNDERTAAIPILMLTALGQSAEVEGLTQGADDYLSKPFHREQLRARIHARLKDRERVLQALARWRAAETEKSTRQTQEQANDIRPAHPLVEKARKQIIRHLHDADYNVAKLADNLHLSRSQLHRALTEHAGRSPSQLLRELRLEAASELLKQGFPVLEVAITTGFTGATVFSRSFKNHFGCPPSKWK